MPAKSKAQQKAAGAALSPSAATPRSANSAAPPSPWRIRCPRRNWSGWRAPSGRASPSTPRVDPRTGGGENRPAAGASPLRLRQRRDVGLLGRELDRRRGGLGRSAGFSGVPGCGGVGRRGGRTIRHLPSPGGAGGRRQFRLQRQHDVADHPPLLDRLVRLGDPLQRQRQADRVLQPAGGEHAVDPGDGGGTLGRGQFVQQRNFTVTLAKRQKGAGSGASGPPMP